MVCWRGGRRRRGHRGSLWLARGFRLRAVGVVVIGVLLAPVVEAGVSVRFCRLERALVAHTDARGA